MRNRHDKACEVVIPDCYSDHQTWVFQKHSWRNSKEIHGGGLQILIYAIKYDNVALWKYKVKNNNVIWIKISSFIKKTRYVKKLKVLG